MSILIALVGGSASAASAQGYSNPLSFGASPSAGVLGQQIGLGGSGFPANCVMSLTFDGISVGSTTTNGLGELSTTISIPSGADLGANSVVASGCGVTATTTVTVLAGVEAAGDDDVTGALPRTGSSSTLPLLALAGVSVALGGALVVSARRRRSA